MVEMVDGLMQGADRDLGKICEKMNQGRFDNFMLMTKIHACALSGNGPGPQGQRILTIDPL